MIVAVLLLGTVLKDVFLIANSILVARLAELTTFDLRKLFYRRTLRMDLATFNNEGTSDLMSRFTNDISNVAGRPDGAVRQADPRAAEDGRLPGRGGVDLLAAAAAVAGDRPAGDAWLIRWLAKMLKRANRQAMEEMAQIYTTLDETFRGIKIVKAFTMERHERRRFHRNGKKYYRKAMKIARYDSLSHPITEVMGILTICLAMLAGAYLVLQGETHLLGIRMCDRPLSLGVADDLLRAAGRRGRSGPQALRRLHADPAGRGGRRPHLRPARSRAAGPRPAHARAAGAASPRPGVRARRFRLPAGPAGAARHRTCGSPSARRSPSSAPTAAARARWPT